MARVDARSIDALGQVSSGPAGGEWPFEWYFEKAEAFSASEGNLSVETVYVELWVTNFHRSLTAGGDWIMGPGAGTRRNCCALVIRAPSNELFDFGSGCEVVCAVTAPADRLEWESAREYDHVYHLLTGFDVLFNPYRRDLARHESGGLDGEGMLRAFAADGARTVLANCSGERFTIGGRLRSNDAVATRLDLLSVGLDEYSVEDWRGVPGVDARRWMAGGVPRSRLAQIVTEQHPWEERLLFLSGYGWPAVRQEALWPEPDPPLQLKLAEAVIPNEGVAASALEQGWSLGALAEVRDAIGASPSDGWLAGDWVAAFLPTGLQPGQVVALARDRSSDDQDEPRRRALAQRQVASDEDNLAPSKPRQETSDAKRSILYMARMALQYGRVGSLTELLDAVASFRQYKPFQALLVLLQRPGASHVFPAHHWEERYGYVVRPDEQPLVLLQRGGPVMFLFDVSQVEPGSDSKPLPPALRNPYEMSDVRDAKTILEQIVMNAKLDGIRVGYAPSGLSRAGCAFRCRSAATQQVRGLRRDAGPITAPVRFEIVLNRAYSSTEQVATIAHELGHIYCGHLGEQASDVWPGKKFWRSRDGLSLADRELEAESVAKVVFQRFAPGMALPPHLYQYFGAEPSLEGVNLEPILTSAGRVLDMAAGFAPRR